ncbi:unnamed protein product [Lota lota]
MVCALALNAGRAGRSRLTRAQESGLTRLYPFPCFTRAWVSSLSPACDGGKTAPSYRAAQHLSPLGRVELPLSASTLLLIGMVGRQRPTALLVAPGQRQHHPPSSTVKLLGAL